MEFLNKNALARNLLLVLITLSAIEGALRLAGSVYDSERPFVFASAAAPAKTVLCLGDSYTYGGNVKWDEAYPYQMWLELKKDPRIRVVNKGHCEYNSGQVLSELVRELDEYKPDYAILLVGASDKWNLIGCDPESGFEVCRRDYDKYASRPGGAESFLGSLRVYKLLRGAYLNYRLKKLLSITGKAGMLELDRASQSRVANEFLADMVYASRYEEALQVALAALGGLKKDSPYFSDNLSFYFAIAVSYEFQSRYASEYVAGRMKGMLAANPDFADNKVFLGYLNFFEKRADFEKGLRAKLERNLSAISGEIVKRKIKLIVMNYPSDYSAANAALRKTALDKKAVFIDVNAKLGELIKRDGRPRYLMGDDHATPAGHRVIAREAAAVLGEALR